MAVSFALQQSSRTAVLCLALVCALPSTSGAQRTALVEPAPSPTPIVPAVVASPAALCPRVEASLTATVDSKKVQPGDLFRFSTLAPVTYGDTTIPAATNGVGLVATMDRSKSEGHSGYLVLEARYLETADGSHVPVTFVPGDDGHAETFQRAGSSSAGVLGFIPFFFLGTAAGVFNTFHHGKDAAVVAGTHLVLIVGDALYTGACRVPIAR